MQVERYKRLRTLVRYCGYKDEQLEDEILQQFVSGIGNHAVEMKICSLDKPTLEAAIETAVTAERLDANVTSLFITPIFITSDKVGINFSHSKVSLFLSKKIT
jgi:hypothetical protein